MGKRIKCSKCGTKTRARYQLYHRRPWLFKFRQFRCRKCGHFWAIPKTLTQLRQDEYVAEEYYGQRYPHSDFLRRLELEHAADLARRQERIEKERNKPRTYFKLPRIVPNYKAEIKEAKKKGDKSKLLSYLP